MHPYDKVDLIPYRSIAAYTAVGLMGFAISSVLFRKPLGLAFLGLYVVIAAAPLWHAFRWHPEPTARRQFFVAGFVLLLIGFLGCLMLDWTVAEYHQ